MIELCEEAGCTDPVLKSVFSSITAIAQPGNTTTTGPLFFAEIAQKFLGSDIWRYVFRILRRLYIRKTNAI